MSMNRKTATKLLLVQWARFQNECIRLEGSTLLTGVNGSGKSTVLDAMTYLLTGNTQFNKAAKDRDRTVIGYVRGDTKSNGTERYLRTGEVISYIAMEFWSPLDQSFLVVGVCMESDNEIACRSSWFICRDARIDEINFTSTEGKRIRFTPKNELAVRGEKLRSAEFLGKERGVEQVLRALGLRCNASKYRSRLLKMMAFNPENNIDQFIQDCVLEPGRVDSLKELREQRHQFDHVKEMYENLRSSKAQLETIEQRTGEYERKLRSLRIRELMLLYQDLREKEEEKKQEEIRREALKTKKERLEIRQKELDKRYKEAGERCRIAENNDIFRGVRESIQALERQIEKLNEEKEKQENGLALLMKLQAQISAILKWADPFIEVEEEDRNCLAHLSEGGRQIEEKLRSYLRFKEQMQGQKQIFWEEEIHCGDRIRELDQELDELETEIKQLKSNQMVFPKNAEAAKRIIYEELKQQGIQTDVRLFAELVQEVKDAEWRAAIETFLGRKRFYIIVDGQYCHKAMEVLERRKLHGVHVVITDKLPETDISAGSAAEMLVIPNVYARRYANYLLNGIHLCGSLEELHEYPRGGLMKNGMLAKSYAVSNMDVDGTEFCLGGDAIRLQLNRKEEAKKQKQEERRSNQKHREQSRRYRSEIEGVDWEAGHYDFDAAKSLEATLERKERIQQDIDKIQSNPDFLAVLQEQQDAEREYGALGGAIKVIAGDIGSCKKELEQSEAALKKAAGEIYQLNQDYERQCMQHLELKRPMLEEYEKLLKGKTGTWRAITKKTVMNLSTEVDACVKQMESAQIEYCKLAEIDINRRGTGYIPFYRDEYRNIANIKIEEAHNKLEEQGKRLESAFMNDFVAEINETIQAAKDEIEGINRELKKIPFGNDTYRFVMTEKADRSVFFRICKKLEERRNDR